MSNKLYTTTMALAGVVLATPAYAQPAVNNAVAAQSYNAVVSLSCVAEDTTDGGKERLLTVKANNREIIAWCNSLDPTDPENASEISNLAHEQAIVVDENYVLRVINRCTGQTICRLDLADGQFCARAANESGNSHTENAVCNVEPDSLDNIPEVSTILEFNGSLRCQEKFTEKGVNSFVNESTRSSFSTRCQGYPTIGVSQYEETLPCTMTVSTGSPFQAPKNCEVPQ